MAEINKKFLASVPRGLGSLKSPARGDYLVHLPRNPGYDILDTQRDLLSVMENMLDAQRDAADRQHKALGGIRDSADATTRLTQVILIVAVATLIAMLVIAFM
jgi:hypothetical protein